MSVNPNFTNANAKSPFFALAGSGGGGGNPSTISGFGDITVSSIKGVLTTSSNNPGYCPIDFILRPVNASQGGIIFQKMEWDALDTGANYALITGATNTTAIIASVWPGYISMPLTLTGANISLASDNETFLYLEGNAGALGYISTGTPLYSGSNLFSSITAPGFTPKANMTALLSTLAGTYPACFS